MIHASWHSKETTETVFGWPVQYTEDKLASDEGVDHEAPDSSPIRPLSALLRRCLQPSFVLSSGSTRTGVETEPSGLLNGGQGIHEQRETPQRNI
jgi:hypothetical protein